MALPPINFRQPDEIIIGGYTVAMMGFAHTSVVAHVRRKTLMWVDLNQEIIGLDAANLAAGLAISF
jgi:MFS superfamily sulfate permease-like transporter